MGVVLYRTTNATAKKLTTPSLFFCVLDPRIRMGYDSTIAIPE